MGNACRGSGAGGETNLVPSGGVGDERPQNPRRGRVAGVAVGSYKPYPFQAGAVFGDLTCLGWERVQNSNGSWGYYPKMQCVCGSINTYPRRCVSTGKTKRCNACRLRNATPPTRYGPAKAFPFEVGHVVGEFTCLGWKHRNNQYDPWMRCSCGWEGFVQRGNISKGLSTRCDSCARKKARQTLDEKSPYKSILADRAHRNRLLDRISACIVRCENPNATVYADYGGRGIRVWPAWVESRVGFLRYLLTLDGWDKPELQLDRIDNNRGYEPGNLRFCTRSENMANKRRIKASDVEELKRQIVALEQENANLRHSAGGAAQPVPSPD